MSRERDSRVVGAAPEVGMAILDSDVHNLRDQTDRDRRMFAERVLEFRGRLDRIEQAQAIQAAAVARVDDTTRRLEASLTREAANVATLAATSQSLRGSLRAFTILAPLALGAAELVLRLVHR